MSEEKETITIRFPESFSSDEYTADNFNRILSFFNWSLKHKKVEFDFRECTTVPTFFTCLLTIFSNYLLSNNCEVKLLFPDGHIILDKVFKKKEDWDTLINSLKIRERKTFRPLSIFNSKDREKALVFGEKFTESLNIEYEKTLRYFINEILYNTLEHGKNKFDIASELQFAFNEESKELSFAVTDVGVSIRRHLRQTYPNLATDSEAILQAIEPQISGTFGKPKTGYETKNNAGVGLFFSRNIAQRLNADMFIVSGNGFVHISPTKIIAKELENQWKGTFVYVKMKLGLIEDLNFQKMLSEITKSIPKTVKVTEDNNLYISVRNYFGKYAEDKDLAKKIRDEKLLPALADSKTLTIDFEEIISAPHSLLNAMLATPIERLGLAAYKKIRIINAAPEIRETLDFIFDDNTSNA